MSAATHRVIARSTGLSKRSSSSTADVMSEGSARSAASSSEMREKRVDGIGDQAHRRLVTRDDEEHDHAVELVLGESVASVLGEDERADEVVGGLGASLREQIVEVRDELVPAALGDLPVLRRQRRHDDVARPRAEPLSILDRDAEQLRDDGDGERESEVVDELHAPALLDQVDQIVGDLLDARAELLDDARRERLRHEPPQATVVVAVLGEEVLTRAFVGCNLGDVPFELGRA